MAKNDLTDEEILARIEQEESQAYGINDAQLSEDRARAFDYYMGQPFGNEEDGRSQVVSRDVLDVVESALPQLLKIFVSGDQVVKFEPKGREDVQAAEQETDYINHVVMEKNNGFSIFYTWFKTALMSKNAYVKAYYEEEDEVETETYKGLTDNQLAMIVQDDLVTVVEHTQYPDEMAMQQRNAMLAQLAGQQDPQAKQQLQAILSQPEPMIHDVKIEVSEKRGGIEIENVAPEDIMISTDCRSVSVQDARFVQHRAYMTRDEMEEQGWDVPENIGYTDGARWQESNARDLYGESTHDQEFAEILVKDTYISLNGERKRYVTAGNHILWKEDAEIVPFACITPHIMPYRHIGMSYADLTMDIQLIKSSLVRGQLDSMYLANSPRFAISDRVNLEDMLTTRPGGVVRTEGEPGMAIMPLMAAPPSPISFNMVEYMDSIKEKRTGITAYNQGLDADSLNKTATGVNTIMQASQQRLELVARTFAETGVKELFTLVHRLVRTHYTKPDIVRLRNEWVEVDPRQWKSRSDMSVSVGLGTGNKDQQLSHLANLFQMQMGTLQAGLPIVRPENIYETMRQIAINAGFKQPEQFVTDPKLIPPPQPQEPPQLTIEKMKLQADQQKFQAQTQFEQQKADKEAQLDIQKFQAEAALKQQEQEKQLQQEQLRSQNDLIIEREKLAMQAELERFKAQLKAETDIKIAAMEADIKAAEMQRQHQFDIHKASMDQQRHEQHMAAMNKPKKVLRDQNGRVSGVE